MNKKVRNCLKINKWVERLKKLFYTGRRHYNCTNHDTCSAVKEHDLTEASDVEVTATTFEDFKKSKIGNKLKDTNTPYTDDKKKETKAQKNRSTRHKAKQDLKQVVSEKITDTDKVETEMIEKEQKNKVSTKSKKSTAKKKVITTAAVKQPVPVSKKASDKKDKPTADTKKKNKAVKKPVSKKAEK